MKKYLLLALILLPVFPLVATGGIEGMMVDVDLDRTTEKEDDFKASETDIAFRGGLIFEQPFERWPEKDLRPYAIFGLNRQRNPDTIPVSINEESNEVYFGLGAAAIYNVHQNHVNIGVGPQLETTLWLEPTGVSVIDYDSYFRLGIDLAMIVNLEFQLKKCMWFFAGLEVASLNFTNWSREFGGVKDVTRTFSLDSDIAGLDNVRIGFSYRPEL